MIERENYLPFIYNSKKIMNNYKLTIITPVYNSAKYIKRFIKNFDMANQHHVAELLFIDDGSTDNSRQLLNEVANQRDNVSVLTQNHQFQSAARNLGMKHAHGDYFLFLDVDDTFSDQLFDTMLNQIKNHDLAICGIKRVLKDNTLTLNKSVLEEADTKADIAKKFLLDRDQMDSGLWNKLFKANIIKDNHLQFSNKNFVEDILFVFNYLMCIDPSKINYYHHPLYTYYQNPRTTTTSYYSELDQLADSYIQQVDATLAQHNIPNRNELAVNTTIRTKVYVIHRHILGDTTWNAAKQKEFLTLLLAQVKNSDLLPRKYQVGILLMKLFPNLYIKAYRQYKRVH